MYTVFWRKFFYPHHSTIWPSLSIWFHKSESIFVSYKLSYQMWNLVSLIILILLTFDFKSYTKSLIYKTGNRPINYRPHTVNWQFLWLNFPRDCFAISILRDIVKYGYGGDFSFKSCWISWIQNQLKFSLLSWMGELPNMIIDTSKPRTSNTKFNSTYFFVADSFLPGPPNSIPVTTYVRLLPIVVCMIKANCRIELQPLA